MFSHIQFPSITTQSVPSLFNVAHLPAVAARIAVPGVALSIGTTFEEAETTVNAAIVFMVTILPSHVDAAGRVIVHVAAQLKIMLESSDPSV